MKSNLTITFLGTGTSQGIPIIGSNHPVCLSSDPKDKRLRVSVLLSWPGHQFVIDCGPDFRQQMLRENVAHIDGVLLTHEHNDHVAGIDDIRPFFFRQGAISFYAEASVFEALRKRFEYIFTTENKYPGAPTVTEVLIQPNQTIEIGGKAIVPIRAFHGSLPILGFKIDSFAYMTDVKTIPDVSMEHLQHLDVLVINALRETPHDTHLNLEEALAVVEKLQPKQTYFTHISHLLGFHAEVTQRLPKHVHLAYDTLKINL